MARKSKTALSAQIDVTGSAGTTGQDIRDIIDSVPHLDDTDALGARLDALEATSDAQLIAWAEGAAYEPLTITRSGGAVTSATVKWPDGSSGTLTVTTVSGGMVDAYTITHDNSSRQVVQAAVTRDGEGNVSVKPALTVEAI